MLLRQALDSPDAARLSRTPSPETGFQPPSRDSLTAGPLSWTNGITRLCRKVPPQIAAPHLTGGLVPHLSRNIEIPSGKNLNFFFRINILRNLRVDV